MASCSVGSVTHFNPRSLAGATYVNGNKLTGVIFQSTLPRGSDGYGAFNGCFLLISIHAPSRERQTLSNNSRLLQAFQSTLPRGSDFTLWPVYRLPSHFNPRSLAGATMRCIVYPTEYLISIHAPSRERLWF